MVKDCKTLWPLLLEVNKGATGDRWQSWHWTIDSGYGLIIMCNKSSLQSTFVIGTNASCGLGPLNLHHSPQSSILNNHWVHKLQRLLLYSGLVDSRLLHYNKLWIIGYYILGPTLCLLLFVNSDGAQPITGQAQLELTPSKGQTSCSLWPQTVLSQSQPSLHQ